MGDLDEKHSLMVGNYVSKKKRRLRKEKKKATT